MSGNWANRGKAAAAAQPLSKKSDVDRGTRYNATVEHFILKSFKTGSFGIEIKYTAEGLQRPVFENIVLSTMSPKGALVPTKYGEATLKYRLKAFGLSSEEITQFPIPLTVKDESEAYNFAGTPVVAYLGDEEYMGKPKKVVRAVWPTDANRKD